MLLTVDEVARETRLPVYTVYVYARRGVIPGVVHIGRRVRVDSDVLRAWLAAGGTLGEADGGREPAQTTGRGCR